MGEILFEHFSCRKSNSYFGARKSPTGPSLSTLCTTMLPSSLHLAPWNRMLCHLWAATFQAETEIVLLWYHSAIESVCTEVSSDKHQSSNSDQNILLLVARGSRTWNWRCCSIAGVWVWCPTLALWEGLSSSTRMMLLLPEN